MAMTKKTSPVKHIRPAERTIARGKVTRQVLSAEGAEEARIASLYSMSRTQAARVVKRAGIVTASGNLAAPFK